MRRDTSTMEETSNGARGKSDSNCRAAGRPTVTFSPTPPTDDVFDWPFPDIAGEYRQYSAMDTLYQGVAVITGAGGTGQYIMLSKSEYTTLNITRNRCCHRERVRRCRMQENRNHRSQ